MNILLTEENVWEFIMGFLEQKCILNGDKYSLNKFADNKQNYCLLKNACHIYDILVHLQYKYTLKSGATGTQKEN